MWCASTSNLRVIINHDNYENQHVRINSVDLNSLRVCCYNIFAIRAIKTMPKAVKRVRCSNFSSFEENTLVALAVKNSSILECKKSDRDVWEAKNTAWRQIQAEFITATGTNRDVQNLKDKYENLKRRTKKLGGDRKKDIFQTEGGTLASCSVAPSATHDISLGILGSSAIGLDNPFDGDAPGNPLTKSASKDDVVTVTYDEINNCDSQMEYTDVQVESDVEGMQKYYQEKIELIAKKKIYFENEERRAQERHDADQLRAKEKHEWAKVHHNLTIEKMKLEINDLKKHKHRFKKMIGNTIM